MLRLLAVAGEAAGAKGLSEEYETPREKWEATVDGMRWSPGDAAAARQAAVAAFLAVAEA